MAALLVVPASPSGDQRLLEREPPTFGAARYLVLRGRDTLGAAVRDGRVRCVERC